MGFEKVPSLRIGDFEAAVPIVQGGMGVGISLSGLASAVANEGGIGVISAAGIGMLEPDFATNFRKANERAFRKEIRKAREMTDGIVGANIMLALNDFDTLTRIAVEEEVDMIFMGAGLPLKLPATLPLDRLWELKTKFVPIISSGRAANLILHYWERNYKHVPDAIVIESSKAGGHLGFKEEQIGDANYSLDKILPDVLSAVRPYEIRFGKKISVIVGGGVYDGTDIYRYMKMGADGVQMATRFVATEECDASLKFKEAYLNCKQEDLVIIESPVGLPGRAIRNRFLDDVKAGVRKPFKCPWKCLKTCDYREAPYCIALALTNAKKGNFDDGFAFAGSNAYRVDRITSVKELVETLMREYKEAALSEKKDKESGLKI